MFSASHRVTILAALATVAGGLPSAAAAQLSGSRVVHVTGIAADVATTYVGLRRGFEEATPFIRDRPEIFFPAAIAVELCVLEVLDPPHARPLRYVMGAAHWWAAIHNIRVIRRGHRPTRNAASITVTIQWPRM